VALVAENEPEGDVSRASGGADSALRKEEGLCVPRFSVFKLLQWNLQSAPFHLSIMALQRRHRFRARAKPAVKVPFSDVCRCYSSLGRTRIERTIKAGVARPRLQISNIIENGSPFYRDVLRVPQNASCKSRRNLLEPVDAGGHQRDSTCWSL
jgi:hypothetical protein